MTSHARFHLSRGSFTLDVDFRLPDSGVTGVFGPSGCGKTTLLRCLAGLEKSVTGRLTVNGTVWQSDREFAPPHHRSIGYVFQDMRLFDHLSVLGNLTYGLRRTPPQSRKIGLEETVEVLRIGDLLDRRPNSLSGGEARRVAIGRALLSSPVMLLLDEPLTGLDSSRKTELLPFLERVNEEIKIPIVFAGHDIDEVCRLCDSVLSMENGSVKKSGPVAKVMAELDPYLYGSHVVARINATVGAYDDDRKLLSVELANARKLQLPADGRPQADRIRLFIYARDVGVTPDGSTDQESVAVLEGTIAAVYPSRSSYTVLEFEADGVRLYSLVPRTIFDRLGVAAGARASAIIRHVHISVHADTRRDTT